MGDERRRQAEELFQRVADLPPEKQSLFLEQHCHSDPSLRSDVESLLLCLNDGQIASLNAVEKTDEAEAAVEGGRIGPYKILQLIGEGGFGSVYMAEQEEPIRRKVALKIIKLGMDTKQIIARFEAERQALAMMDHANIARVLDAGATETGRPYFVMELVRGIPITEYCDQSTVSIEERLDLFIQVCRAVQHAHQKGIIHRDIKPSNVLVTLHDGTAVPKVIDFGIAKAMSQRLTQKTLFTEFLQFIGTPEYMSPEQAAMSGLDVDTRTDIYSLGVLLYELLTSTTPFDPKTLRSAAYGEVQRIIQEDEPPTPSKRVSTLGRALTDVAKSRQAEPQSLSRLIRGDLDWIVMKALEKDRTRRYETALDLVADIKRHQKNEPVLAGPPSRVYKLWKFIRRNRVSVLAGTLVAVALFIGFTLAMVGFVQARRERDLANEEAAHARAISTFLQDMLITADPMQMTLHSAFKPDDRPIPESAGVFARDVSVAEMVKLASTKIDKAFSGRPKLEAQALETMGMTLRGLGCYPEACTQLNKALEVRRRILGEMQPDTLRSALQLGVVLQDSGKGVEAEPLVRGAYEGMRELFGAKNPKTLNCASSLAHVLSDLGRYKESEDLFESTLNAQRKILGREHRDTLKTMWSRSISYLSQWKLLEGQALARELYEIADRTLDSNDSLNILSKPLMGWWYLAQYRYDQAEALFRPGLEQCKRILGETHPFTYMTMHGLARSLQGRDRQEEKDRLYREALSGLKRTRGRLHGHTISTTADFALWFDLRGRFDEAEQLYREFASDCLRLRGETSTDSLRAMDKLASFLERVGKLDEAISVLKDRIAVVERMYPSGSVGIHSEMQSFAEALIRMGRIEEAREVTSGMIDMMRETAEKKSGDTLAVNNYAWTLLTCVPSDMRDFDKALEVAQKAVDLPDGNQSAVLDTLALALHEKGQTEKAVEVQTRSLSLLPEMDKINLNYGAQLVRYLLHMGDVESANKFIIQCVNEFREAKGEKNPMLALEFNSVGMELVRAAHYSMAEPLLKEALKINRDLFGEEHEQVAQSLKNLGHLYCLQGRFELAEQSFRDALAMRRSLVGDDDLLVADTQHALGLCLYAACKLTDADGALQEALDIHLRLHPEGVPLVLYLKCDIARVLIYLNRLEEAGPLIREVLAKTRLLFGEEHPGTAGAMQAMGWLLLERGDTAGAVEVLESAVMIFKRLDLPDYETWRVAQAESTLGGGLLAQGKYGEAETRLLSGYEVLSNTMGDASIDTRTTIKRIIDLYEKWGRPEQANSWQKRLTGSSRVSSR